MKGKVPYLDVHIKEFNWGRIEDIWISQQNGWTCQLAALRIILRYYHTDISEEDLVKILNEEGFSIFDFGTYLPFMGVIALKLGLKITYRTEIGKEYIGETAIISSMDITRKIIYEDMRNTADNEPIMQAYKAFLKIFDLGGKIYFHQPYSPPSFEDIKNALKSGPVIALVSGKEYYKINEDWGHALVLIPTVSNNFIVLDDFKKKGYECYPEWEKYLSNAKKYDWSKWEGRMIGFECKEGG